MLFSEKKKKVYFQLISFVLFFFFLNEKFYKTNVVGTLNMLGLAKRVGARFLLTSTSEVYGDPLQHPQKETYWGNVNPIGTYFFSFSLIFLFSLVNFGHHAKHVVSLFYCIETAPFSSPGKAEAVYHDFRSDDGRV